MTFPHISAAHWSLLDVTDCSGQVVRLDLNQDYDLKGTRADYTTGQNHRAFKDKLLNLALYSLFSVGFTKTANALCSAWVK